MKVMTYDTSCGNKYFFADIFYPGHRFFAPADAWDTDFSARSAEAIWGLSFRPSAVNAFCLPKKETTFQFVESCIFFTINRAPQPISST